MDRKAFLSASFMHVDLPCEDCQTKVKTDQITGIKFYCGYRQSGVLLEVLGLFFFLFVSLFVVSLHLKICIRYTSSKDISANSLTKQQYSAKI